MVHNKNQAQNDLISFWTSLQNYKSAITSRVLNKIATLDDTHLLKETCVPKM
jgi:hypothetical protein